MSKRKMLVVTGSNVMVDTDLDAFIRLIEREWDTVAYDPKTMRPTDAADYDAVLLSHAVTLSGSQMSTLVDATKPGRLFMHACDIQFTDRAPAGANRKPLTLIASLAPAITDTPEGDRLAKAWLKPLHPDSRVVFSEFLVGLVHTIAPEIEAAAKKARDAAAPEIHSFYWGIKRPGVVQSLKALGLGKHPDDAVFGAIRSSFSRVRNLTREPKYDIDTWAPLAVHADKVLLPYEPVKSEYQITRRLLECAILAPDTTVADERLSEHVQQFLDPSEWVAYAEQVSAELLAILDEGLTVEPEPEWSEYGPEVGAKHGELLRWLLASGEVGEGWAVEFGTGNGTSAKALAEHMPVMTFDCFTGLPEKWRDGFDKGAFAQRHIPNIPRSVVVNGLYENTLPGVPLPEKVALLHVDCDLYSSTKTIFERAKDLIQPGTVILFDELIRYDGWRNHEHKAWLELRKSWPTLKVEPIAQAHEAVAYRVLEV